MYVYMRECTSFVTTSCPNLHIVTMTGSRKYYRNVKYLGLPLFMCLRISLAFRLLFT